jgi:hypothetical protein
MKPRKIDKEEQRRHNNVHDDHAPYLARRMYPAVLLHHGKNSCQI